MLSESSVIFLIDAGRFNSALRHRRRLSTQTIQRKNSTGTFPAYQKSKKNKAGKYFLILLILVAIIVAAVIYKDEIKRFLPLDKFDFSTSTKHTTTTNQVQQLPVENEISDEQEPFTPIQKRIQIEVLNGCGVPGIAKKFSDHLKKLNYDVVNSGNYLENGRDNFNVSKTKIIDQLKSQENIARANELADLLNIDSNLIESYENPSPIADLTIIIGKDYDQINLNDN